MDKPSDPAYQLLAGYVSGDLDFDELKQCRQLLLDRPELEAEVAAIESSLSLVINAFATGDPPPSVRHNLLVAVAQSVRQQSEQRSKVISITRRGSRWSWQRLANSVAAALVVGLGWHSFQLQQQLTNTQTILAAFQSPSARIFVLQGPEGNGVMMFDPEMQQASLVVHNMPPAPPDYVYRLWVVAGSRLIPCGGPKPAHSSLVIDFAIPFEQYSELYEPDLKGFILTLEPIPDVEQPTGRVVLQSVIEA